MRRKCIIIIIVVVVMFFPAYCDFDAIYETDEKTSALTSPYFDCVFDDRQNESLFLFSFLFDINEEVKEIKINNATLIKNFSKRDITNELAIGACYYNPIWHHQVPVYEPNDQIDIKTRERFTNYRIIDVTDYYDNYRDYDNARKKEGYKHEKILIYYHNSNVKNKYKMEYNVDVIFKNGETRNFAGVAKMKKHREITYIPFWLMMLIGFALR